MLLGVVRAGTSRSSGARRFSRRTSACPRNRLTNPRASVDSGPGPDQCRSVERHRRESAPSTIKRPSTDKPPIVAAIACVVAVARMTLAPPIFCNSRPGGGAVDVMAPAECGGQFRLVLTARHDDRVKSHLRGELDAEMSEAAQPEKRLAHERPARHVVVVEVARQLHQKGGTVRASRGLDAVAGMQHERRRSLATLILAMG